MDSLNIYDQVRVVPKEALKEIQAGRLRGKSDINPMWRIQKLTEIFGPCGIGWKYIITKQWTETGGNNEISAFVNIDLYIKHDNKWSDAIPGTGGSSFVANESKGLYTSDECYKMALTDAISVACKALGFGADTYWAQGATKYDKPPQVQQKETKPPQDNPKPQPQQQSDLASEPQRKKIFALAKEKKVSNEAVKSFMKAKFGIDSSNELTKKQASETIEYLTTLPQG